MQKCITYVKLKYRPICRNRIFCLQIKYIITELSNSLIIILNINSYFILWATKVSEGDIWRKNQKNGSQIIYLSFKRRLFEADRSISFLLTLSTKLIHKQKISFREIGVERFEALFSHIVGHNDNTAFQIRPVLVSVLRRKVNQHLWCIVSNIQWCLLA